MPNWKTNESERKNLKKKLETDGTIFLTVTWIEWRIPSKFFIKINNLCCPHNWRHCRQNHSTVTPHTYPPQKKWGTWLPQYAHDHAIAILITCRWGVMECASLDWGEDLRWSPLPRKVCAYFTGVSLSCIHNLCLFLLDRSQKLLMVVNRLRVVVFCCDFVHFSLLLLSKKFSLLVMTLWLHRNCSIILKPKQAWML